MNVTKRQHFVQRAYLKPWVKNKTISVYFKNKRKIISTGLMSVAQEGYFYEFKKLSTEENQALKILLDDKHYSGLIIELIKKLEFCENNGDTKFIDNVRKQGGELLQSHYENIGGNCLTRLQNGEYKFLLDGEYWLKFCSYIGQQYVRTKKVREKAIDSCKDYGVKDRILSIENLANYYFPYLGEKITRTIYLNKCKLTWLQNLTTNYFITGDQPIYNLDLSDEVKKLILYYPISPKTAIIIDSSDERPICQNEKIQLIEKEINSIDEINNYNQFIFNNAHMQVFSVRDDDLKIFIN